MKELFDAYKVSGKLIPQSGPLDTYLQKASGLASAEIYAMASGNPSNIYRMVRQTSKTGPIKMGVFFAEPSSSSAKTRKETAVECAKTIAQGHAGRPPLEVVVVVTMTGDSTNRKAQSINSIDIVSWDDSDLLERLAEAMPEATISKVDRPGTQVSVTNTLGFSCSEAMFTLVKYLVQSCGQAHYSVDNRMACALVASILSKPLVILTGLSGSGKTKIAQALAKWIAPEAFALNPVGADWTGNENLLGYPDGLDATRYVGTPALELILNATSNPTTPHFLILDEMNLSHVERYFADFLSAIESGEKIPLYEGDVRKAGDRAIPRKLALPDNLFVIGTVNVDETTYMFSPKVLDRANVIEFRMERDDLTAFLKNPAKPDLDQLEGRGAAFGPAFVEAANGSAGVPDAVKDRYEAEMGLFFQALQHHGAEYGYRVAHEAARFLHFWWLLGNHAEDDPSWFDGAFDCVIVQKLLPKLHGSRAKLGPLLKTLYYLCDAPDLGPGQDTASLAIEKGRSSGKGADPPPVSDVPTEARYPLSAHKIARMWRLLNDNGFASFAEA